MVRTSADRSGPGQSSAHRPARQTAVNARSASGRHASVSGAAPSSTAHSSWYAAHAARLQATASSGQKEVQQSRGVPTMQSSSLAHTWASTSSEGSSGLTPPEPDSPSSGGGFDAGAVLPQHLRRWLRDRISSGNTARDAIPGPVHERLREEMRAGIVDLQRLLGRDLSAWLAPR